MNDVRTESVKTISTVRTALAVILVLLIGSLLFQWTIARQLEIRVRYLERWRATHMLEHKQGENDGRTNPSP